jgi:hypothetical protein
VQEARTTGTYCPNGLVTIFISVTHLKGVNRFRVPNYSLFKRDREDTGGKSVDVLIKRNVIHQALYVFDLVGLEAVAVNTEL